jgi:hypothetical protein
MMLKTGVFRDAYATQSEGDAEGDLQYIGIMLPGIRNATHFWSRMLLEVPIKCTPAAGLLIVLRSDSHRRSGAHAGASALRGSRRWHQRLRGVSAPAAQAGPVTARTSQDRERARRPFRVAMAAITGRNRPGGVMVPSAKPLGVSAMGHRQSA